MSLIVVGPPHAEVATLAALTWFSVDVSSVLVLSLQSCEVGVARSKFAEKLVLVDVLVWLCIWVLEIIAVCLHRSQLRGWDRIFGGSFFGERLRERARARERESLDRVFLGERETFLRIFSSFFFSFFLGEKLLNKWFCSVNVFSHIRLKILLIN